MVTDLLHERGEHFYNLGSILCRFFLLPGALLFAAIQLIALLGWGGEGFLACLIFESDYGLVSFLSGLSYLAIVVGLAGIGPYFIGLHLLGLAQIAQNTTPKPKADALPKL